jgi:MATE family multidrug resistance protein
MAAIGVPAENTVGKAPEGSYREVIGIAWPIVVSMLSYTFMGLADTLIVGQLGTTELAAVGLATTATFTLTCFGMGALQAVKIVAAQAHGAGRPERVHQVAYQGLLVAFVIGAAIMALAPLAPLILGAMGATGRTLELAVSFFEIRLPGSVPAFLSLAAFGYFQGLGDTKTPMRISVLANVLNIVLDYLLVFGIGPFPEYGTDGAALATSLAFTVQGVVGVALLLRATGGRARVGLAGTRELVRLGLPIGVRYLLDVASWAVFTGFIARQGEAHLAAHVIAIRIISVSFLPGHGIGEAASILTGQAKGAGDAEAAHRAARRATVVGLVVMGVCGVLFLLFGSALMGLFRPEPAVREVGVSLLTIAAAFQLFDALAMVKTGALNGVGETRFVMVVSVLTAWALLVPMGYAVLRLGWGAPGAWVAITVHAVALAACYVWRWETRSNPARRASRAALVLRRAT